MAVLLALSAAFQTNFRAAFLVRNNEVARAPTRLQFILHTFTPSVNPKKNKKNKKNKKKKQVLQEMKLCTVSFTY